MEARNRIVTRNARVYGLFSNYDVSRCALWLTTTMTTSKWASWVAATKRVRRVCGADQTHLGCSQTASSPRKPTQAIPQSDITNTTYSVQKIQHTLYKTQKLSDIVHFDTSAE